MCVACASIFSFKRSMCLSSCLSAAFAKSIISYLVFALAVCVSVCMSVYVCLCVFKCVSCCVHEKKQKGCLSKKWCFSQAAHTYDLGRRWRIFPNVADTIDELLLGNDPIVEE